MSRRSSSTADWPNPVPLGPPEPEPLPLDALPAVLRDHVSSVAGSVQVAPDLPSLHALCAVSAAVAGKIEVEVDRAWPREWIACYGMAVAPPAERKSAAHTPLVAPIEAWEADREREVGREVRDALDLVDVREGQLRRAKIAAEKGGSTDAVQAARIELESARTAVPPIPRILAQDATPEALVRLMAMLRGRVAVFSPEGGPLRILDGRYSEGAARLEELAQAYDGEPLRVDRATRDSILVPRPALTLAVCIQPSVLDTIRNARSWRGQGIYGRISWVVPRSLVGSRVDSSEADALDTDAAEAYSTMLHTLLGWTPPEKDDYGPIPIRIGLSDAAKRAKREYHVEIEQAIAPGGSLEGIADWAGKTVGRAIRIATLLEFAARAADGRPYAEPIGGWAMESAIRLCRALTSHALVVFDRMGRDVERELASYVLGRAQHAPDHDDLTVRDLFTRCGGGSSGGRAEFQTMDDFGPTLAYLEDRGWLRIEERPSTGGRPPSPWIHLHPAARNGRSPARASAQVGSRGASARSADVHAGEDDDYERIERLAIQREDEP